MIIKLILLIKIWEKKSSQYRHVDKESLLLSSEVKRHPMHGQDNKFQQKLYFLYLIIFKHNSEQNNEVANSPKYTRLWILSLLKRLKTLLFISAKLLDTNNASKALLWATITVDKVIAWANKIKEWTSMDSQGVKADNK